MGRYEAVSMGVGRELGRHLYAEGDWGAHRSHRVDAEDSQLRKRLTLSVQVYLPGKWFAVVSQDRYSSVDQRCHYTFLELSTRL